MAPDPKAALQWYTSAARRGDANAQFNLGLALMSTRTSHQHGGGDDDSTDGNSTTAATTCSSTHPDGDGGFGGDSVGTAHVPTPPSASPAPASSPSPSSSSSSTTPTTISASPAIPIAAGVARARETVTTAQDKAVQWFRAAAEQGHPDAAFNLGAACANGDGVAKRNITEAAQWFGNVAERSNNANDDQAAAIAALHQLVGTFFLPGTVVQLARLSAASALNGKLGIIQPKEDGGSGSGGGGGDGGSDEGGGEKLKRIKKPIAPTRLPVLLDGETKPKAVRVGNLVIVDSDISF